jgi:hypothetical protein
VILLALEASLILGACTSDRDESATPPTDTPPATNPEGTVSGHFYAEGGPSRPGGDSFPLAGTVTVQGAEEFTVSVGRNGSYTVSVPAGVFTLSGRSQQFNAGRTTCSGGPPVTVTAGQTTTADVICHMR